MNRRVRSTKKPPVAPTGFPPVTAKALADVTDRIVSAFDPESVILFGSYAYGGPTPDSDVDFLIVLETNERPSERRRAISQLFPQRPFPMDIVVRTPAEIARGLEDADPFIDEILTKGRILYERPDARKRVGRQGRK